MKRKLIIFTIIFSNFIYGQIPNNITKEEKIYGLSKFWQEVNYNFVYLDKVDKTEWNKLYKEYISEVLETKNDYEYYRKLQKFCAFLKDGHTNVWFPKEIQKNVLTTDFGDYKLFLRNIEGKAVIIKVNDSKKEEIPIGTEIIKVNGISYIDYIKKNVKPYISTSTQHILEDWSISNMLQGYKGTTYELELKKPNGEYKTIKLTNQKSKETELFPVENNEIFEFKSINNEIVYIALNSFSNWDLMNLFSEKLSEIRKAKKLIIDLRKNGGGDESIGREIIKYLTKDTVLYSSKSKSRLHIPYYKAVGKWSKAKDTINSNWSKQAYLSYHDKYFYDFPYHPYSTENLNITRIEIPTVILIGHNTASAAEDFLVYADNQEHMMKIGEPSFGSTGQPMMFDLPNGGIARVCTKKDIFPSGLEFVGYGIQPDIIVRSSYKDFIEGKDNVLDKAIDYLNKK